jgi:hypothetical protein
MKDQEFLNKINQYAEKVLSDIDPQKTPVSSQLEALKPVMKEIAEAEGTSLEDVFIRYMDLASAQKVEMEQKLKETLENAGAIGGGIL